MVNKPTGLVWHMTKGEGSYKKAIKRIIIACIYSHKIIRAGTAIRSIKNMIDKWMKLGGIRCGFQTILLGRLSQDAKLPRKKELLKEGILPKTIFWQLLLLRQAGGLSGGLNNAQRCCEKTCVIKLLVALNCKWQQWRDQVNPLRLLCMKGRVKHWIWQPSCEHFLCFIRYTWLGLQFATEHSSFAQTYV